MTTDERSAFLRLALTPGVGWSRLTALRERFGSWNGALSAPFALLCTVPALSRAAATAIAGARERPGPDVDARAAAAGAVVLTPLDAGYPAVFTQLGDPPPVVFARGELALLDRPAVAVVGSRHPTPYGLDACRLVARTAAAAGLVVVSGMARGLDAAAHLAALDAGGGSIGVLGNGIGVVYPAANRRLYDRMASSGLLLSEFEPGERPHAGSFPRRNRLIAALGRVTVVVEAAVDSGALITANRALELGREVVALPGPVTSRVSGGTNRLIRDGATPWLEPDDLLGHFPEVPAEARAELRDGPGSTRAVRLREELRVLYQLLDGVPRPPDELAQRLGRVPAEVLSLLTELEIDGAANRRDGGYVRAP